MALSHSKLEDYSMTNSAYIRQLDPIQGLVDYVQDVKPYHTKIIEVMIEYVYDDSVDGVIGEGLNVAWGPTQFPATASGADINVAGDFSTAMLYIAGSPVEQVTIIDSNKVRTTHTILAVSVSASPVTTSVTLSPSPPVNAAYVLLTGDIVQYFSFTVTAFDEEAGTITVSGPATADIFNGQRIRVVSSNNTYTVQGSPTFNGLTTIIPVAETLTGELVGSPATTIEPEQYYIP